MPLRPEQECFNELATLCKSPGYAHAIASFCLRDHVVAYGSHLSGKDYAKLFRSDRLIRTEISTLIGLMLRGPRDLTLPNVEQVSTYLEQSESLLKEIHEAMMEPMAAHMQAAMTEQGKNHDINPFTSAEVMREPIFYAAESAYSFQYRDFAAQRYIRDEDWLRKNKGFSPSEAQLVVSAICSFIGKNLLTTLKSLKQQPPEKWTILDGFQFSVSEISKFSELDASIVQAVVDAFTFPETENPSFTSLNEFNEANAFPIIRANSERYLLFLYVSLTEAFYDSPFYWMVGDNAYITTAMKNRGLFTEEFSFGRFEQLFGSKQVFKNVNILESKDRKSEKLGEIDTLILFGDRAIVLQAKSKKLTLLARKGNDLQLQQDFKSAVQDACDQAIKCSEYLASSSAVLVDAEGQEISTSKLRSIHPTSPRF